MLRMLAASRSENVSCDHQASGLCLSIFTTLRSAGLSKKVIIAGTVVSAFSLLLKYLFKKYPIRYLMSELLAWARYNPEIQSNLLRTAFIDLPATELTLPHSHTHPLAASDRSASSSFITRLGQNLGRTPYFYQMSTSDVRNDRMGCRSFYWAKDLTTAPARFNLPARPLISMVDVDQYVDMPDFLAEHASPTIVYTFQPDAVSKVSTNYAYFFNEKNEVEYYVTGSGFYCHPVWNYSVDNTMFTQTFFGIPYKTVAYLVDRRMTSPDHEMILFSPIGTWYGPFAILSKLLLSSRLLERLQVVMPSGFCRLRTVTPSGVMVSTGRPGSFASSKVSAVLDDVIASTARSLSLEISAPTVLSFVDNNREVAAMLVEYHRAHPKEKPPVVCPIEFAVRRYAFAPCRYSPEAKPSVKAFMNPLIHGAFAPDRCVGNEERSVVGRVEDVRPPEIPMDHFLQSAIRDFSVLLIPDALVGRLVPLGYEDVKQRQNTPKQRRVLTASEWCSPKRLVSSFMKSEAYQGIKDPRVISTINGTDKREYSRYIYAFEAIIKEQKWYAFSKSPKLIADRVVEVLRGAKVATNTDFSRFDGHGSNVMRELERTVLTRAFHGDYHNELLELHRSQYNLKAVATFGTWYDTAYSRASGSPETSIMNSLVNSFVAFLALRMTPENGGWIDSKTAYKRLGIYGGDDGLTADVMPSMYMRAAERIGQKLTVELIKVGQLGIKFLARVYSPNVWFGDVNSICDLPRQLSKFHVTVVLPDNVTAQTKLLEKVRSYLLTDSKTPILGEYCQKVADIYGMPLVEQKCTMPMRHWLSQVDIKDQYPNEPGDWVENYVTSSLPNFSVVAFRRWLNGCTTIEALLAPPMFSIVPEADSKVPVVVDQEILPRAVSLVPEIARDNKKIKASLVERDRKRKETFAECQERKRALGVWEERKRDETGLDMKHSIPVSDIKEPPPLAPVENPTQRLVEPGVLARYVRVSVDAPTVDALAPVPAKKPPLKRWVAKRQ